jgi:hypothetical protein
VLFRPHHHTAFVEGEGEELAAVVVGLDDEDPEIAEVCAGKGAHGKVVSDKVWGERSGARFF